MMKSESRPDNERMRYSVLDCLSRKDIGKSITLSLSNGRTESGILREIGMFDMKVELSNKRPLIVMKHAIVTVSLL